MNDPQSIAERLVTTYHKQQKKLLAETKSTFMDEMSTLFDNSLVNANSKTQSTSKTQPKTQSTSKTQPKTKPKSRKRKIKRIYDGYTKTDEYIPVIVSELKRSKAIKKMDLVANVASHFKLGNLDHERYRNNSPRYRRMIELGLQKLKNDGIAINDGNGIWSLTHKGKVVKK